MALPLRSSQSSGGNGHVDTDFKLIEIIRQLEKLLLQLDKLWVLGMDGEKGRRPVQGNPGGFRIM